MATVEKEVSAERKASLVTVGAMIASFVLAFTIFIFFFGNPSNFQGGDNANEPLPGNYLGIVYKGGFVVPLIITQLFMVIIFTIERYITIGKAFGTSNLAVFVKRIKGNLDQGDIKGAIQACDKQKGSVANVIRNGLTKYEEMKDDKSGMTHDQKVLSIQKEIEESTTLELPMLERNMSILATIATVATLFALFGTVLGMIRAFAALATAGAPDSAALATGISEALINTASGIGTSALAIICYNYLNGKIDTLTYSIDEAGYTLSQTFASREK
jgi:biopolymer transport protein ExbB